MGILFGVDTQIMLTFYNAVLESIIRYGMASWYGTLAVQLKSRINNMVKAAMKVIKQKDFPSLHTICESTVVRHAHRILKDTSHILHFEYKLLPSARRYRVSRCKSNRFKLSFLPTSITLLNKKTGESLVV